MREVEGTGGGPGQPKDVRDVAKEVIENDVKNAPAGRPGKTTPNTAAVGGRQTSNALVAGVVAVLALAGIGFGIYSLTNGGSGQPGTSAAASVPGSTTPAGSPSGSSATGGQSSLNVQPMGIHFVQSEFATHYIVNATDSAGLPITYQWILEPPANDPGCNNLGNVRGTTSEFVWHHGDQDGCDHTKQGPLGHEGTVAVTVSDGQWACRTEYQGTEGPNSSPDAAVPFGPCMKVGGSTASVIILDNKAIVGGDICFAGGTVHFEWTLGNAKPGDAVAVRFSGPGLPAQTTLTVGAGGKFSVDFPIKGSGSWTSDLVSIGGQPAPTSNGHNGTSAKCG